MVASEAYIICGIHFEKQYKIIDISFDMEINLLLEQ